MTRQIRHARISVRGKRFAAGHGGAKPKNFYQGWCLRCRKMVPMENTQVVVKKGRTFITGNHKGFPDHKMFKIVAKGFKKDKNYAAWPTMKETEKKFEETFDINKNKRLVSKLIQGKK